MLCFACPNCHEVMSAPDDAVGETVACPMCYQYLQVPKMAPTMEAPGAQKQKAKAAARQQQVMAPPPPAPPRAAPPPPVTAKPPPNLPVATPPPPPPPKPRVPRRPFKVILREKLAKLPKPTLPKLPMLPKKVWLGAAGAVAFLGVVFLCMGGFSFLGLGSKGVKPSTKQKLRLQEEEALSDITAKTLFRAYQENVVKADNEYKGKELYITGELHSVDQPDTGQIIVYLSGGRYELTRVSCVLDAKYRDDVAFLKPGAKIRVKGICEGKSRHSGHVMMNKCDLLKD